MRILHVIHGLSPAGGGPPENLRQMAHAFDDIGVRAEVLSQDDPRASYLRDFPLTVHALGPVTSTYGHSSRLRQWLEQHAAEYDGVVIEGLWQYHGPAVHSALQGKIPYIVIAHGMLDPWFRRRYPFKHLKKYIYWFAAQYLVLHDAYRVVFASELEARLARRSFWPHAWKHAIAPLGTNQPEGDPALQREIFYRVCPGARGRRFILFLGRIHEKKGCDLLIEAFARVAGEYPDLDIVMAGPDPVGLRAKLEVLAAERGVGARVHWPGMLLEDAKWGAFHASEAFTLPSHGESFGVSIAEAIACSKPVLISDKINIWNYVTEDGVGFVEDDTTAGTERLLRSWLALADSEKQAMIARTRECFERRFSMRNSALMLRNIFEEALAERATAARTASA